MGQNRNTFTIRYWGTRGSFASCLTPSEVTDRVLSAIRLAADDANFQKLLRMGAGEEDLRSALEQILPRHHYSTYGGNTTCVELRTDDSLFIIDAGSGLRELGIRLNKLWNAPDHRRPRKAYVLITHAHMDHTFATPFTDPYYDARNDFTIMATQDVLDSLNAVLGPASELRSVYFPVNFDQMAGVKRMVPIAREGTMQIEGTTIHTCPLNHPGGCVGFRFEREGKSFVFATDHEHLDSPDPVLTRFARDSDVLYADAQYLQAEYDGAVGINNEAPESRHGWGHSTVEAAVRTAVAAGVARLHLGHHDPKRTDEQLAGIERFAKRLAEGCCGQTGVTQVELAYEEMVVLI